MVSSQRIPTFFTKIDKLQNGGDTAEAESAFADKSASRSLKH